MHLTLAFLGSTPDDQLPAAVAAVTAGARGHEPFPVTLDHAGRFPKSGPPRVAWLGMTEGAAEANALAEAIRKELSARVLAFDEKPFRAHVTLGRVREKATREEARAIGVALDVAKIATLHFSADAVHVVESHVSSKGPRYTSRANVPLRVGGKP